MNKEALRSRLQAMLVNVRMSRGEEPRRDAILGMSIETLVRGLKERGVWEVFQEKYTVVEANGEFYDPVGKIE